MKTPDIGVALITHHAKHHLPFCLPPLIHSPLKPKILLVNSSGTDGTVELAREYGVETLVIPRNTFNHGKTRELARKKLGTEIVVMATPDAYPEDSLVLTKLVAPLVRGEASLSYARQLPHQGASLFEAFPRFFNYPEESQIRSLKTKDAYGVYSIFFSDSFGAYINSALDSIGGFSDVLTGEDTLACSKLLQKGHNVAYVAEARVHHSHDYTLVQEFKRHFDTGLARESYKAAIEPFGTDSRRGKAYVKALLKYLIDHKKAYLIPYAVLQSGVKWCGYQVGKRAERFPLSLKRALSGQDFYWKTRS